MDAGAPRLAAGAHQTPLFPEPSLRIGSHCPSPNYSVEGALDAPAFAVDGHDVLAPTVPPPGQIVILDTLSVHQSAAIRQAIEAHGCQLVVLPASSPDLTPIEQAFSQLKAILRRLAARTREALLDALAVALEAITAAAAQGWFRHAGYPSLAQAP